MQARTVLITGAGSGVGRASALRLAKEGANVVCADIRAGDAERTAVQARRQGGDSLAFGCDVSSEEEVAASIRAAVARFGRLDVMCNNVGIPNRPPRALLEEHTLDDFERLTAVNFRGVFLGCKHSIRQFKSQGGGGVIVNTGSVSGLVGFGGAVYGATKGAVHQLTRAAAVEGAPFGIRVNAICPGGMPYTNFKMAGGVEMAGPDEEEALARQVASIHPLGRVITPEDCAEAIAYLVSDRAANVTGVLLPVDGGFVAR